MTDRPEPETCIVSASRLAWKEQWNGAKHECCEGDIHASYSADLIGMDKPVRKPFKWKAELWLTVSMSGHGGVEHAEAYRMVPAKFFAAIPTTYRAKTSGADDAENARNDPKGFYDGMAVKHGGDTFVLSGPPVRFMAEPSPVRPDGTPEAEPQQMSLFC